MAPLAVTRTTRGADGTRGARRTARAATGLAADLRAMRTGARAERVGRATTAFIVMVGRAIRCDQNGSPDPGSRLLIPGAIPRTDDGTRDSSHPEFQTKDPDVPTLSKTRARIFLVTTVRHPPLRSSQDRGDAPERPSDRRSRSNPPRACATPRRTPPPHSPNPSPSWTPPRARALQLQLCHQRLARRDGATSRIRRRRSARGHEPGRARTRARARAAGGAAGGAAEGAVGCRCRPAGGGRRSGRDDAGPGPNPRARTRASSRRRPPGAAHHPRGGDRTSFAVYLRVVSTGARGGARVALDVTPRSNRPRRPRPLPRRNTARRSFGFRFRRTNPDQRDVRGHGPRGGCGLRFRPPDADAAARIPSSGAAANPRGDRESSAADEASVSVSIGSSAGANAREAWERRRGGVREDPGVYARAENEGGGEGATGGRPSRAPPRAGTKRREPPAPRAARLTRRGKRPLRVDLSVRSRRRATRRARVCVTRTRRLCRRLCRRRRRRDRRPDAAALGAIHERLRRVRTSPPRRGARFSCAAVPVSSAAVSAAVALAIDARDSRSRSPRRPRSRQPPRSPPTSPPSPPRRLATGSPSPPPSPPPRVVVRARASRVASSWRRSDSAVSAASAAASSALSARATVSFVSFARGVFSSSGDVDSSESRLRFIASRACETLARVADVLIRRRGRRRRPPLLIRRRGRRRRPPLLHPPPRTPSSSSAPHPPPPSAALARV